jgi:hypothetical protein
LKPLRCAKDLSNAEKTESTPGGLKTGTFLGTITFERVVFAYPTSKKHEKYRTTCVFLKAVHPAAIAWQKLAHSYFVKL